MASSNQASGDLPRWWRPVFIWWVINGCGSAFVGLTLGLPRDVDPVALVLVWLAGFLMLVGYKHRRRLRAGAEVLIPLIILGVVSWVINLSQYLRRNNKT